MYTILLNIIKKYIKKKRLHQGRGILALIYIYSIHGYLTEGIQICLVTISVFMSTGDVTGDTNISGPK